MIRSAYKSWKRCLSMLSRPSSNLFSVSEEVRQALNDKKPVLSLESTIYTHGFPFPDNLNLAKEVEKVARDCGVVPATCAFINGTPRVGLNEHDLVYLTEQKEANKVSRRDIGYTMASSVNGGTTISSTMILSKLAGIDVFATGGLGGVHRDGQHTMDVSADLTELGRTPVAVVCAGPKSILDINLTMEYLETQGVFVGTFNDDGRSNIEVPGFYTRDSGVLSPYEFNSFKDAAKIIFNSKLLALNSGQLFCIPPPRDVALDSTYVMEIIKDINKQAQFEGIRGKELTPYFLKAIADATQGKSVESNHHFVLNNVRCGAEIAKELVELESPSSKSQFRPSSSIDKKKTEVKSDEPQIDGVPDLVKTVVVGSISVDSTSRCDDHVVIADSNPGSTRTSIGGVGYNISLAHKYSSDEMCRLISVVGNDPSANIILSNLRNEGVDISGIKKLNHSTAHYMSAHDSNGELIVAIADMSIMEQDFADHIIDQIKRARPANIVIDCNIMPHTMSKVLRFIELNFKHSNVIIEPTSAPKAKRLSMVPKSMVPNNLVNLITPTKAELSTIYESFEKLGYFDDYDSWFPVIDSLRLDGAFRDKLSVNATMRSLMKQGVLQQSFNLLPFFQNILVKLGEDGIVIICLSEQAKDLKSIPTATSYKPTFMAATNGEPLGVIVQYFDIPPENKSLNIKNVSGAGDTLLGFIVSKLDNYNWLSLSIDSMEQEWSKWEALYKGQLASGCSLISNSPVNREIRLIK